MRTVTEKELDVVSGGAYRRTWEGAVASMVGGAAVGSLAPIPVAGSIAGGIIGLGIWAYASWGR